MSSVVVSGASTGANVGMAVGTAVGKSLVSQAGVHRGAKSLDLSPPDLPDLARTKDSQKINSLSKKTSRSKRYFKTLWEKIKET